MRVKNAIYSYLFMSEKNGMAVAAGCFLFRIPEGFGFAALGRVIVAAAVLAVNHGIVSGTSENAAIFWAGWLCSWER